MMLRNPTKFGGGTKYIERIAAKIAQHLGYKVGDDLNCIIERLNGQVRYVNYDTWVATEDRSLEVFTAGNKLKFVIHIPLFTGPIKDRFSIAHELGHYILHSRVGKIPIWMKRFDFGELESEANWFAAGFLMPEEEFRGVWESTKSVSRLAARFKVTENVDSIRKNKLSLPYTKY